MNIILKIIQYCKGNYKNNKREGYGNMIFNNYEIYEGNWENNKINSYRNYSYNQKKFQMKQILKYVKYKKENGKMNYGMVKENVL